MKKLIILFTMLFTVTVFAGVAARDISGGTSSYKGVFSDVVCDKGVECVKAGAQLKIRANSVKTIATLTSGDATPSVANGTYFVTHATPVIITAFDDGTAGQEIIIFSQSSTASSLDVTGTTLKCGTADIAIASGDVTKFVNDGTNWRCTARLKASGSLN
jgi:hypothetical protein